MYRIYDSGVPVSGSNMIEAKERRDVPRVSQNQRFVFGDRKLMKFLCCVGSSRDTRPFLWRLFTSFSMSSSVASTCSWTS